MASPCDSPNEVMWIKEFSDKLAFLGNVAASAARYKDIIDAGGKIFQTIADMLFLFNIKVLSIRGLKQLPTWIDALKKAKTCLVQEDAFKHASHVCLELCKKDANVAKSIMENGSFKNLLDAFMENPAYEDLAENLVEVIISNV